MDSSLGRADAGRGEGGEVGEQHPAEIVTGGTDRQGRRQNFGFRKRGPSLPHTVQLFRRYQILQGQGG